MCVHLSWGWTRPPAVHLISAALGLLVSTSISGCTVLAYSLGALSDRAVGKGGPSHLLNARRGVNVTLWLNDGRKLNGVFEDVLAQPRMEGAASAPSDSAVVSGHGNAGEPAPSFTDIVLLTDGGERDTIPAGSVDRVSIPVARGKVKGAIGGLVFDALILSALIATYSGGF